MAMSAGTNKNGPLSDPNIVPLIDVLLVLIIIFMVVTPTTTTGLPAVIPQPAINSKRSPEPETIVVQVLQGQKLMINQEPANWSDLGTRLSDIFKTRAEKVVFVKGDKDLEFQKIAQAIDIAHGAGIDKVGLMTPQVEAGQ